MRRLVASLPSAQAKAVRDLFKVAFGASLSDLSVDQHSKALTWLTQTVKEMSEEEAES